MTNKVTCTDTIVLFKYYIHFRPEHVHIEKYVGGLSIYVIMSRAEDHVMCTFLFERVMHENTPLWRKNSVPTF
jgi:hypothetical protein